jgi:hypothetical protein
MGLWPGSNGLRIKHLSKFRPVENIFFLGDALAKAGTKQVEGWIDSFAWPIQ